MSERVGVVIPAHNQERFIAQTIESALRQTLPPAEVWVVDDGSTDATPRIVQAFGPPVRYVRQANQGQGAARNAAIRQSAGEYIAFLDHDDVWLPQHLEAALAVFQREPQLGVVASRSVAIDEQGRVLRSSGRERPVSGDVLERVLTSTCLGSETSTVVVARRALETVGVFDERLCPSEDWHLWVRLAARFRFGHTGKVTACYRVYAGGASRALRRLERQRLRAIAALAARPELEARVPGWPRQAVSNTYLVMARCHCAAGERQTALRRVAKALRVNPAMLADARMLETLIGALMHPSLARRLRRVKWRLEGFGAPRAARGDVAEPSS